MLIENLNKLNKLDFALVDSKFHDEFKICG